MNTLFIDEKTKKEKKLINEENNKYEEKDIKKIKIDKKENNIFKKILFRILKFEFCFDILEKTSTNNTMYLSLDKKYIDDIICGKKRKITRFMLKVYIHSITKNFENIDLLFSKSLDIKDNKSSLKKYIISIIQNTSKLNIGEITENNTMKKNDLIYIDTYIKSKKISLNKLKILVILNQKQDYINDKIVEYISKYKFVDILKMNNITKIDYKYVQEKVTKINDEYGSTIDIIQKRNISNYNVYINYSNVEKQAIMSHYILKKQSKFINMKDAEEDILGISCKTYQKGKYELETLFNRMGIDANNFSKNKLGNWLLKK
ncbi:MAG: hypothetical protein RSE00_02475 [Clostridia bacterium]